MQHIELNAFDELGREIQIDPITLEKVAGNQWAVQRNISTGESLFLRPIFEDSDFDSFLETDLIFDIGIKIISFDEIEVGPLFGTWGTGGERNYSISKVVATLGPSSNFAFELANAIGRAEQLRENGLKTCKFCNKKFSPDELYEKSCCYSCASEHLGVVF